MLVFLLLFLFSCVAQPALVRASAEHDADRPYSLGPALRFGLTAFWPMLGLKLLALAFGLVVLLLFGLLILGGWTSVAAGNYGGLAAAIVVGVLLGLLLIPVAIVFSVVYILAVRAIALDSKGPIGALGESVRLVRRRLGRVALLWLIMLGVEIGIGVALALVLVVLLIPLGPLVFAGYAIAHTGGLIAGLAVAALLFLPIALVAGGAAGAYTSTYWTLAYRRLEQEALPAAAA